MEHHLHNLCGLGKVRHVHLSSNVTLWARQNTLCAIIEHLLLFGLGKYSICVYRTSLTLLANISIQVDLSN